MLVCQGELDIGSSFSSTTEETDVVIPQLAPYPKILFFSLSRGDIFKFTAIAVAVFQTLNNLVHCKNGCKVSSDRIFAKLQ